jgi:hypothetical protein
VRSGARNSLICTTDITIRISNLDNDGNGRPDVVDPVSENNAILPASDSRCQNTVSWADGS